MKKSILVLMLALASVGAGAESCRNTKPTEFVQDIWLPGHYPGTGSYYCVDETNWLLKIQAGTNTFARCVPPQVGQKQVRGTPYQK